MRKLLCLVLIGSMVGLGGIAKATTKSGDDKVGEDAGFAQAAQKGSHEKKPSSVGGAIRLEEPVPVVTSTPPTLDTSGATPIQGPAAVDNTAEQLAKVQCQIQAMQAELERLTPPEGSMPCGYDFGFAFMLAKPHFSNATAIHWVDGDAGTDTGSRFSFDRQVCPRFWVGYTGANGLGLRTEYWQFDAGANTNSMTATSTNQYPMSTADMGMWAGYGTSVISAEADQSLSVASGLYLTASDLELTKQINYYRATIVLGGGLRYLHMNQDFNAVVTENGLTTQSMSLYRSFQGIGPTVSIDFHHPVGTHGLAFLAKARGAYVFGDEDLDFYQDIGTDAVQYHRGISRGMATGDLEVGFEWQRRLSCGANLLLRTTYEGQIYANAGAPNCVDGDLAFEGLTFAAGITR